MSNYIEIAYNNNPVVTLEGNIESSIVLNTTDTIMAGNIEIKPYVDSSNLNQLSLEIAYKGQTLLTTGGSITQPLVLNTKGRSMIGDITLKQGLPPKKSLEETSWDDISMISQAGVASSYFSVGDRKTITLNGTVGSLELNNVSLQLFILGFDHNSEVEGTGISFGGFKLSGNTKGLSLVDPNDGDLKQDGTLAFNMNHWGSRNYGGWKGCDLRYDILGSTNVAPSGYGSVTASGRVGYDPNDYDVVNSPKPNTLLAALPADLRAVMKPMTKWTDNVAGGTDSVESNVTASIDYIVLPSVYEVLGTNTSDDSYYNVYERSKQQQYQYFQGGSGTSRFYKYNDTSTYCNWLGRSVKINTTNQFCYTNTSGRIGVGSCGYIQCLSPVLLV